MIDSEPNPLLLPSPFQDDAFDFDSLQNHHFLPALEVSLKDGRAAIAAITRNPEPATFSNTIEALETSGESVGHVSSIFFNLFGSHAQDGLEELAQEISPKLSAYSNDIVLDDALFARIKHAWETDREDLTLEQKKLADDLYKSFTRNGALLSDPDKALLREIDQELAGLSPAFAENIRNATNAYELVLTDEADLAGLPPSALEAARACAAEKDKGDAWVFTLDAPSFSPFLKYADKRDLREGLWRAYSSRAFKDEFDNQDTLLRTVTLRHQRAQLLGYESHAHFVLEERMADTPERVLGFLSRLADAASETAKAELADLKALRHELEGDEEIKPWDTSYYSEKLKQRRFDLDQEALRPYFQLENVIEGMFEHARLLYDVSFSPADDIPGYHADVRVYTVTDNQTQAYLGLFYTDFFPRSTKRNGAWMSTLREQGLQGGEIKRPHVSIVCNFTKPTPSTPSLLTFDEVETMFHEFGHALHTLLTDCTYTALSGCNVFWDFVELPSQIMENWVVEKTSLDLFARHYETGEPMPEELALKIKDSARFMAGSTSLRQLSHGFLDMAWHTADPADITTVEAFETAATAASAWLPREPGSCSSPSFSHIFAGGYAAGYYSYKWAEVLDADAFESFKQAGLFDKSTARRFRTCILERGGVEHPLKLYKDFKGQEPDPDALLRRDGLID